MKKSPFNKVVIIIIVTLFVPILSYTVYQYAESDDNERLIKSIYQRQLDSILFSVNQYCWDIFSNWQSEMTGYIISDIQRVLDGEGEPKIDEMVHNQRVTAAAFVRLAPNKMVIVFDDSLRRTLPDRLFIRLVDGIIDGSGETLQRSIRLAKEGYIKPLAQPWNHEGVNYTLLIFPILHPSFENGAVFGGLLVDNLQFIQEVVGRRFSAMSEGKFVFAVSQKGRSDYIYRSDGGESDELFEAQADLWIIPDLELKARMAGTTLERVSKGRVRRNRVFLFIINVVFIIGLLYVIHNVNREMEIARIKGNLVANVSHEIRTPVALIRMYAETLEMGRIQDEEKRQKYYRTILAETVRLSQLINNMLDFSKIESHMKQYHFTPGRLDVLVQQVLDMYQHNFEQNQFKVEVKIEPNLPEINMDAEAVTQAFVNLLDNAMKYSTDNKYIGISLTQRNEHLVLSVTDHGIGIPQKEFKKIFQKFYRVGDSLVHNTKGSGLGLSLVEHIMNVHHGRVEVESTVGKGSTFSLFFPKIQGE